MTDRQEYRWRLGQVWMAVAILLAGLLAVAAWPLFREAAEIRKMAESLTAEPLADSAAHLAQSIGLALGGLSAGVLLVALLIHRLLLRPILRATSALDRQETGDFHSKVAEIDLFYRAVERVSASLAEIEEANRVARAAQADLRRLASTDELTGVANRRWFTAMAGRELDRARRFSHGLALLMIDIDHFKRVNDTYGHGAGDEVLRRFARTLEGNLRSIDLLGRMGGEEFAVMLPETAAEPALHTAERLRTAISALDVTLEDGKVLKVTASVGVAVDTGSSETLDRLMARADGALYAAKEQGRDRVVIT